MCERRRRLTLVGLLAVLAVSAPWAIPSALAGHPGVWTRLPGDAGAQAGKLLRTPDGVLHAVYMGEVNGFTSITYDHVAIAPNGSLVSSNKVMTWPDLVVYPALVPHGTGLRLIFSGAGGPSPYDSVGAMYTATSTTGANWTLVEGSMSQHTNANQNRGLATTSGTTLGDGTPVASWFYGSTVYWHVGVDPAVPAASPDASFSLAAARTLSASEILRDPGTGQIWAIYHVRSSGGGGTFARRIADSDGTADVGPELEAPNSTNLGGRSLRPFLQALSATTGPGGGMYAAYCAGFPTCTSIRLWRVGAARSISVPRSAGAEEIDLAAAPDGRVWVTWCRGGADRRLFTVRTGPSVGRFGGARAVKVPGGTNWVSSNAQATKLDVIVPTGPGLTLASQLLPGLAFNASPTRFGAGHTVTFRVMDAGTPVVGATIRLAGKVARTGPQGVAHIYLGTAIRPGAYPAVATAAGYAPARKRIRVT
jgi:hypothetical protein